MQTLHDPAMKLPYLIGIYLSKHQLYKKRTDGFVLGELCDFAESTILELIQYSYSNCKNNAVGEKNGLSSLGVKVCKMLKLCFICRVSLSTFNFLNGDCSSHASHPILLEGSLTNSLIRKLKNFSLAFKAPSVSTKLISLHFLSSCSSPGALCLRQADWLICSHSLVSRSFMFKSKASTLKPWRIRHIL